MWILILVGIYDLCIQAYTKTMCPLKISPLKTKAKSSQNRLKQSSHIHKVVEENLAPLLEDLTIWVKSS